MDLGQILLSNAAHLLVCYFFSETWLKYKFWFSKSVTQLRFCFSNKLPGDASAADLWTTLLQESFREPWKHKTFL